MDVCKRSGQIPAFGNWDYANDLPITQYFESARQAGLIRFSSASGECDPSFASAPHPNRRPPPLHFQKENGRERRCSCAKEQKKQGRVCDVVAAPPRKQASAKQRSKQQPPAPTKAARPPKAVDEDLYKIPPDLLHSSKRKKMWGIFPSCLVPTCMA
ncbi:uncharacterized protein LOC100262060 [Vitis vinifera]|uniref:RIN4 pathogenic type III effector avirulence factor Avr cleavage site domain-containing protein n=1 Tax=Vitis vinifera TaxID=29760 RepID=D7TDU8_VITVI|eukprot:XP_002271039.1 PREDICTED: uncharacterized protein LOC100262060 [Vitis vinifera]